MKINYNKILMKGFCALCKNHTRSVSTRLEICSPPVESNRNPPPEEVRDIFLPRYKLYKLSVMVLATVTLITSSSCGTKKNNQTPQQQSATGEQSDKIPDQLKSIEQSIEQVFQQLNGPAVKKEEDNKNGQQGKSEQGGKKEETKKEDTKKEEGKKEEGKDESSKEGVQQKQQPQTTPQPTPPDPWQKINTVVNELHYQWNSYSPMALKMGANKTSMDNFSNSLNALTNTLNAKNNMSTMLAASTLYGIVPDFYYLYKTKSSPEIKKVRHYTRSSMLFAMSGNWAQADAEVNNLKSSWNLYKNTVSKDQQEQASKLEYAIYEYEKVVKEKNQQLSDIKGRVTMVNISTMEKAMEEAAKK